MQQLAGGGALVADDRRPRIEAVEASQPVALEDGVDRGAAQAGLPGQAVRTDPPLPAQLTDLLDHSEVMGTRLAPHRAAAIDQTGRPLTSVAVPPLRAGLAADTGRASRPGHRPAADDALHQDQSTPRCQTGVSMCHEGPSSDCGFTPAAEGYGPSPVNNLIGN